MPGVGDEMQEKDKPVITPEASNKKKPEVRQEDSDNQKWSDCQNELNRIKMALKTAQATIESQDHLIQRLKEKADRYLDDNIELRKKLLKPK